MTKTKLNTNDEVREVHQHILHICIDKEML